MLVDLSGLFWASWHATVDQEVSAAYALTISKVRALAHGYDYVAICCDAPPYFRKEILSTYKAQRDAPPEQALAQFRRVKDRLAADGFLLWGVRGFEADDVIATATKLAVAAELAVTIASGDKDLLQLVSNVRHVRVVSTMSDKTYDDAAVIEKFEVPPAYIADSLALIGDKSDNVPGVPGVGPKIAGRLVTQWGGVEGVLDNLPDVEPVRIREAIAARTGEVRTALRLVELRYDVPIEWDELFAERKTQRLTEEQDMSDIDDDAVETEGVELESAPQNEAPQPEQPKPDALAKTQGNGHGMQMFEQGLQPGTLGAAYKLARGLYESRLYSRFPNAEAIWAVIIRGREMGLGALTALDTFHVIEGKPAPSAHLLVSRAKQHPDCEYFQFISGDDKHAEYETKNRRNPRPTRLRYTIEQATRAGLLAKSGGNWSKRPEEMLRKTAAVQLARLEFPDALLGAYAAEELETA
jgi:5'-3' exonuclease